VAKSTIQQYIRQAISPLTAKQTWATFLRNHAKGIWAVDFLQTYDLFIRAIFVFVVIELGSRRLVHFVVTRFLTGLKELSFWPGSGQNRENDERIDREPKISGFESQTTREDRDFRLLSRPTRAHIAKCDVS